MSNESSRALMDNLRKKTDEMVAESKDAWSCKYLQNLIGNFAGYIR